MDFKVTKKENIFTLTLIVIGVLFTTIGTIAHWDDANFITKFLSNSLINSLFFFGIGLGALFFLALQYATETGWYVAVKRVMEAITGYIPYGIAFLVLVFIALTITDGAHVYTWMDPEVFVRSIKDLPEIKKIATEAIKRKSKAPIKKMIPVLQDLFEEYYLGYLLDRFDEVKPLLADWIVAYYADQAEQEKLTKKKTS